MSEDQSMAAREVLYRVPGMAAVAVERGLVYGHSGEEQLTLDLYRPPGGATAPLVVLVAGFSDAGFRRMLGRPFKDLGFATSWCRLFAASGIAAVAYENRRPVEDLQQALTFLGERGAALGVDPQRLGLWATSGHGPLALGALATAPPSTFACVGLGYPYTLDLDGATAVADAAKGWGFSNPGSGQTAADLPPETPVLVVRAGQDGFADLNAALDRFVEQALKRNLPLTCINHAAAPHAFDLELDDARTHYVVGQILAFFAGHLL